VRTAIGIVAACSNVRWLGEIRNSIANRDHASGTLQAGQVASRFVRRRLWGKHPHDKHQVHEIETGRGYLDLDLIGLWDRALDTVRTQRIKHPRPRYFDLKRLPIPPGCRTRPMHRIGGRRQ
jgi:hypothetical protein